MHFRNQIIPGNHFHKKWQLHVKTWFDQPAKKARRASRRLKKSRAIAPRPVGLLRPVVRCPTIRYNKKVRAGKGFSIEELKSAGINKKVARTIGIAVDHRRRNKSIESVQLNSQRLKEYKSKLILFPRKGAAKKDERKKDNEGVATETEQKNAVQNKLRDVLRVKQIHIREKSRVITPAEKAFRAYSYVREARGHAKSIGRKEKKAKEKEQEIVPAAKDKAPKEKAEKAPKEKKEKKTKGKADEE